MPERSSEPAAPVPEVALPQGSALEGIVSVLEDAIQRIKSDGQRADLGLLYDTALRVDPNFRSHVSRRTAILPLLEALARKGLFMLSEADGLLVIDSVGPDNAALNLEGLPADPGTRAVQAAKPAASEAVGPAPAPGRSVDLEFNVSGPVADALSLIVPVLRANKDLAGPGLSRAELKNAVLEAQPDFKCTQYGVSTYRDLFSRARNEGLLEIRDEDGQGARYFGTERLSEVPLSEA